LLDRGKFVFSIKTVGYILFLGLAMIALFIVSPLFFKRKLNVAAFVLFLLI